MKIQKLQNISFKGFSNIISLQNAPVDDKMITYISAKLDNEGTADLDKLKEICCMKNIPLDFCDNQVLTLMYIYDKTKCNDALYFQDKHLYWGDKLKEFSQKHTNKMMSSEDYKAVEKFHMKTYTFLADITKRIASSQFNNEDDKISMVIKRLFKSLQKASGSEQEAFYLLRAGCMKISPFQEVSGGFYRAIIKTMENFFK